MNYVHFYYTYLQYRKYFVVQPIFSNKPENIKKINFVFNNKSTIDQYLSLFRQDIKYSGYSRFQNTIVGLHSFEIKI